MRRFMIWAIFVSVITFTMNADAHPIIFTHSGIGSGNINGSAFSDAAFTITATADTDNRVSLGYGYYLIHDSASINIDGVGNYVFTTKTLTYVSHPGPEVGFSRGEGQYLDLIGGPINEVFANWDMLSSIGPVSGIAGLIQWSSPPNIPPPGVPPVMTDGGILVFSYSIYTGTFAAVTVQPPNRPPVLSPIGNKTVNENETLQFTVTATDPDGNQVIYSANNLPPGATFDPVAQVFSWTPTFDQAGTYPEVEFTAMDNWQPPELAVELITITVGNVNRAPVFTPVGVQSANEWDTLQFSVSATDYDGNEITYWTSPLPHGATFDPVTRVFTWTPVANQAGSYKVIFYATDNDPRDPQTGRLEVAISVSVPSPLELGKEIEDCILALNLPTEVFNSYWANVKKVRPFIRQGNFSPAANQLLAFINKIETDMAQGKVSQADGNRLTEMAAELLQNLGY